MPEGEAELDLSFHARWWSERTRVGGRHHVHHQSSSVLLTQLLLPKAGGFMPRQRQAGGCLPAAGRGAKVSSGAHL